MRRAALILLLPILLPACAPSQNAAKYDFSDGSYRRRLFGGEPSRVYIHNTPDGTIEAYDTERTPTGETAIRSTRRTFPLSVDSLPRARRTFYQPSFDLDVLTIPFKVRPSTDGFPPQLNTAFNGAFYVGYRSDAYHISYARTPLGNFQRSTSHYGISAGLFGGIGATPVNPWVTKPAITDEYDGLVLTGGAAAIVAVNTFSFGVGVGTDHLTDPNRRVWIYRGQPWAGIFFGLNLN